jgi:molybdopterin molybdotransferase
MKPGKPLVFGRDPRGVPCFGLPGNPVSSYIAFELFVRPALRLLQGARRIDRPRASARLATDHVKAAGRSHYLRARLERQGNHMVAHLHPRQGSATLSSLVELDALVELAAEIERVRAGDEVPVLLLAAV